MQVNIDYSDIRAINIALFIWQLPQNFIALIIIALFHSPVTEWKNEHTGMTVLQVEHSFNACWSLGQFIFVNKETDNNVKRHESGHSIQSLFFGPLYLLLIGIPSVCLFIAKRLMLRFGKKSEKELTIWYHSKYPEKWANSLGGVSWMIMN